MSKIENKQENLKGNDIKSIIETKVTTFAADVKDGKPVKGFLTFVREQGVVGLSVGIVLGGAVSSLSKSLVNDIVSPILSLIIGRVQDLQDAVYTIKSVDIRWGAFVVQLIDFVIIAAVIYFVVKGLGLDRLDEKKEKKVK